MEVLNLYDRNGKLLDKTFIRGGQLNVGEFYRIVEIWTINREGKILVTLRAPNKVCDPLKWEITGGAVRMRESSRDAAIRELKEETGLEISKSDLKLISCVQNGEIISDVYLVFKNFSLSDIILQFEEVIDAKLISVEELYKMIKTKEFSPSISERIMQYGNSLIEEIEKRQK